MTVETISGTSCGAIVHAVEYHRQWSASLLEREFDFSKAIPTNETYMTFILCRTPPAGNDEKVRLLTERLCLTLMYVSFAGSQMCEIKTKEHQPSVW